MVRGRYETPKIRKRAGGVIIEPPRKKFFAESILAGTLDAALIKAGTIQAGRIPNISASKIISGTFIGGDFIIGSPGQLKSTNYVIGSTGFRLHPIRGLEINSGSILAKAIKGWGSIGGYFERDSSSIIEIDYLDFDGNVITLTGLSELDLVTGKVGRLCYEFDGINDYYLIANNANQSGMSALTIETWIFPDAFITNRILVNKTDSKIDLFLQSSDTTVKLTIVTDDGTESLSLSYGTNIPTGAWTYLVLTWDKNSPSKLYINGTYIGDGNNSGNGAVSVSANGIYVGCDSSGNNRWDGKIDGIRMLRRKMSAAEILSRYQAFV